MNADRLKRLDAKHYERKPRNDWHAYFLQTKRLTRAWNVPLSDYWPWYHLASGGRDL